jgi:glycosyltransferase involved in cell wall biosynthesis
MKSKKHIVYLGNFGFPYGFAEVQKIILISKGLVMTDNSVTVICARGIQDPVDHPDLRSCGEFEGIKYIYTSGDPFYRTNFFRRNFLKMKGFIKEFLLLRKLKRNNELDYAILSTHNFYAVLYYCFLAKMFNFKTALNYVEFYSRVKKKWYRINTRLNDKMFDKFAPILTDSVLPISEFLVEHLKKKAPNKKYLKIPVLTDFDKYADCDGLLRENLYFLFCGHTNYAEIIKFNIDSFNILNNQSVFLYLVINGSEKDIQKIREYVNTTPLKDQIKLFSKLSEKELYTYYRNALALLIPLRPTFQDRARFPHKLGEYLASGNPVISTNYGEVSYYFKDMDNMLIAESYDMNQFAAKMQFAVTNIEEVRKIGINGKNLAFDLFNYIALAQTISDFLN